MSVVDFAALPPEVNSARMYAGAGSGPLVAAAAAWDRLAAELGSAASSYQTVVSELTSGPWQGPSAAAMTTAVAPYVQWMSTTAAQAEHTASQARTAAAAYEAAFSATVPPAVIAANRALLTSLVSSNVLGQNAAAIAANQAQYSEMWAQDAAAMHGYAANSAAATALTPFTPASSDANPAAQSGKGPIDQLNDLISQLGSQLHNVGSSGLPAQLLNLLSGTPFQLYEGASVLTTGFQALVGGTGFNLSGIQGIIAVPENAALMFTIWWMAQQAGLSELGLGSLTHAGSAALGNAGPLLVASGSAGVSGVEASASLGRSASVGGLSVPQAWGAASPEIRLAATSLPAAGAAALPQVGPAGPGGRAGLPAIISVVNAPGRGGARSRWGARTKARAGLLEDDLSAASDSDVPEVVSASRARDELDKLRRTAAELAKKREELTESAVKMLKQPVGEAIRP